MAEVLIYTRAGCAPCGAAKALLARRGVAFVERDVEIDPRLRGEMIARSAGRMTLPQVFIGGKHVGGYSDLYELQRTGQLDRMLEAA